MVLINVFIGMLIDFWKISKVLQIYKTANGPPAKKEVEAEPAKAEEVQTEQKVEGEPASSELRQRKKDNTPETKPEDENNDETPTKMVPWSMEIGPYTIREYEAYCESPTKKYRAFRISNGWSVGDFLESFTKSLIFDQNFLLIFMSKNSVLVTNHL